MDRSKFLVAAEGDLSVFVVKCGHIDTNVGLIENASCREAVVIDASFESFEKSKKILSPGTKVVAVFFTHGHWDHMGDGHIFQKNGAKVYAHRLDRALIEHPELMANFINIEEKLMPCRIDCEVEDGTEMNVNGWLSATCSWVPGHTMGGVIFYMPTLHCVFAGDTLFRGCIGRSDFPGGNEALLIDGIRNKILTLPEDSIVVPGHGKFTTIGNEKTDNEFLL
ncbi:MAG: MBL fold metallo-hydrolase [Puniceicoccales bacterium]|jgi:glyoxylase-like metal-dependent hydrolase (beta-lactamase superfamily II)|nr:MBL fold metallo-hydrolase [Puniceicoccales bacterium]